MNSIINIREIYLRSSRTIEKVLVSNIKSKKIFYVYNYEGYSYRVFENLSSIKAFFDKNIETKVHFNNEEQIETFFLEVNIE